jgi:ribosomal protein S18 acetylase RimI-like enzyme
MQTSQPLRTPVPDRPPPASLPGPRAHRRPHERVHPGQLPFAAVTLRPAGPGDVDALRSIAVAAYQHYVPRIGQAPAPVTADYEQAARSQQAWVAVEGGEVLGFAILITQPGYLLLDNVAVRPDAQSRGIGTRLLDLAEDHARSLHLGEVRLYTNEAMTDNLSYYSRHGYAETHRAEQDGFRRVYFRKPLD